MNVPFNVQQGNVGNVVDVDLMTLQNNVAALQGLELTMGLPFPEMMPGIVQCWDMSSLKRAIAGAVAGTGQVREIIQSCVFSPREQAFTSLIKMCGNSGEWQKAIEIFEAMYYVGRVRPNTYTYSALIAACSTSRQWSKAVEVYELMKVMSLTDNQCHPNKVTFCAIISACEKGGYYEKALKVFQEMIHVGVPVDEWSLRAALSSCAKTANWKCAEGIVFFLRNCQKSQTPLPTILAQASSIEELKHAVNVWLASKAERGAQNDSEMHKRAQNDARIRAPWDMDTLKSAIFKAKAGSGEIAEALKTCTFIPRAQAFTTLINLCGRLRESEKAIEVFEAMESVRGVRPNTYTYSALIAACSSSGEWEKALEIFHAMKRASLSNPECIPNEVTYSTVITACQRGGLVDTAMDLYEEMLNAELLPDQGSFNSILSAVERNERYDLAEKILADMHKQGLTGNPSIYCELIDSYKNAGDWQQIMKLYEELKGIQGHPEEAVRQEVIKALKHSGDKKWTIETSTPNSNTGYSATSGKISPDEKADMVEMPLAVVVECSRGGRGGRPYRGGRPSRGPRRSSRTGRKPYGNSPREKLGIRMNDEIEYPSVRLLTSDKEMLGVFQLDDALRMAKLRGVDLVLQNEGMDPPLCRLIEWGKYKYEIEKRQRDARQKQRAARIDQKELKMRPGTDVHDYQVRLRKALSEIDRGNHVKLIIHYRGREIQNKSEGEALMNRFVEDVGEKAVIEKRATMEGRNLTLTLAPNRA